METKPPMISPTSQLRPLTSSVSRAFTISSEGSNGKGCVVKSLTANMHDEESNEPDAHDDE